MTQASRRAFLQSSIGAFTIGAELLHGTEVHAQAAATPSAPAPSANLAATIDASQPGAPISPYLYGMFLEQLGNLIYRSLWSEALDDRKFFFPVTSEQPQQPSSRAARFRPRKWQPVGGDDFVTMDAQRAFVGEHSPRVSLDVNTPRGIRQSGLSLRKGIPYKGRVLLAGAPAGQQRIEVTLGWGDGPMDRQAATIADLAAAYGKFALEFAPRADTDNGWMEIRGTGHGTFHVGAISLMPADNVQGFRPDTVGLLRNLNSSFYRLPGGNFISDYDWRAAVGADPDLRAPTWDYAWNAMQPNDVGMDEWMTLCKLLAVEPYVTVDAGFGDAASAAALVEYANGSASTPMGALRAQNGRPEPYGIKFWNLGNEMYGFWQIGHTYLRWYVLKHNAFAKAMRKADPSITIIACGAMPDEMTVTGNARLTTGKVQAEYGTEADWTGGLLKDCSDYLDALSEHWYARSGMRFDPGVGEKNVFPSGTTTTQPSNYGYVPVEESLVDWARRPANRVRQKAEAWEEYVQRFPAMKEKKIFLAIDEWAYTGMPPNLRLALSYAMVFHEMFRHADFLRMAAFTFGISCLAFDGREAVYNSTGLLFKLYREHFGTLPAAVSGNSPQPAPKWPVGGDQPRVNSGSPTYPLDLAAALTADRKFLTIGIVNPTESAHTITLKAEGIGVHGKGARWLMTGPSLDAANVLGKPPQIEILAEEVPESLGALQIAPISICIYRFPVTGG